MLLTSDRLIPYLRGAVEWDLRDGALCPVKCSRKIRENWEKLAVWLRDYAEHTSGIRLDFVTDASRVSFAVAGGAFDLLAEGSLVAHGEFPEEPGILSADLSSLGETRVTLVFPNLTKGRLYSLEIPEKASLRPWEYEERILFLGDSITQGWSGTYPSLSFAQRTSAVLNADCVIHGVGGGYFHPTVFEAPENFDPDRVVIAMGTNDHSWGHSPRQVRAFAAEYLDRVKELYGEKRVYCILPIWRHPDTIRPEHQALWQPCLDAIREEETARGFTVIDGGSLVPHDERFFNPDRLHPNDLGFSLYAQNLIRILLS